MEYLAGIPLMGGLHNVFFNPYSQTEGLVGKPTLTVHVNQQEPGSSFVYEFAFKPTREGSRGDTGDDSTFDTPYVSVKLPYQAPYGGSARAIAGRLYVVVAGVKSDLVIVDTSNASTSHPYEKYGPRDVGTFNYDAFIRVRVGGDERIAAAAAAKAKARARARPSGSFLQGDSVGSRMHGGE